jgi:DNA-3-methyladenine glycosylase II
MKGQGMDAEKAALAHLKRTTPYLYKAALPHRGQVLSRVKPKRTRQELFNSLASSIISQQLSTKAANSIYARVVDALDGSITPPAIRKASTARLRKAGLSESKVKSLKALADAIEKENLDLLALKRLPPEEAIAQLTRIYGIGQWTAEMFLIFALGSADVFSPGDLILDRQMRRVLSLPESLAKKELGALARQWSPHRSYVALLFWKLHHAENG